WQKGLDTGPRLEYRGPNAGNTLSRANSAVHEAGDRVKPGFQAASSAGKPAGGTVGGAGVGGSVGRTAGGWIVGTALGGGNVGRTVGTAVGAIAVGPMRPLSNPPTATTAASARITRSVTAIQLPRRRRGGASTASASAASSSVGSATTGVSAPAASGK